MPILLARNGRVEDDALGVIIGVIREVDPARHSVMDCLFREIVEDRWPRGCAACSAIIVRIHFVDDRDIDMQMPSELRKEFPDLPIVCIVPEFAELMLIRKLAGYDRMAIVPARDAESIKRGLRSALAALRQPAAV